MTDIKNIKIGDWVVVVPLSRTVLVGPFVEQVSTTHTVFSLAVTRNRAFSSHEIFGSFASEVKAKARSKEVKSRLEAHFNALDESDAKLKRWRDALDYEDTK